MTSKFLKYAGLAASTLLIALGIGAIATGVASRDVVHDNLAQERITGSDDMTPAGIAAAVEGTKLENLTLPTCSVAGEPIQDGSSAKCFAEYMRIHALEATDGRTYSQMGQYLTGSGEETSDKTQAAVDPKTGQPTPNAARNVWVTETALATALNTSYFAESVGLFALVMGFALLLTGIGFLVGVVRWMREPAKAAETPPAVPTVQVPA